MRLSRILITSAILAGASPHALAASTQEGADKVKAALESVFTATPGLVTVTPGGDAYDLKFDLAAVMNSFAEAGVKGEFMPLAAKLLDLGGGKWQVTTSGPQGYSIKREPDQYMEVKVDSFAFDGEFDEALGTFSKTTYSATAYTTKQNITDPTGMKSNASGGAQALNGGSTSVANPQGGVDSDGKYTMTGLQVDNSIDGPSGPMSFSYTVDEVTASSKATGARFKEITNLAAWFVARPAKEKIIPDQESLKASLRAGLPLWENMNVDADLKKLTVNTLMGNFTVDAANLLVNLNGLTKEGKLRERFALTGLQMPAGLAPAWSTRLLPKDITVDFTVSGFDAGAVAALAIDKLDLSKDPPIGPEHQAEFMRLALPTGTFNLAMDPNLVKSDLYELTFDGSFAVSLAGFPSGKGNVRMTGFDATLQALQEAAASDPSVQQVLGPLMVAKGFGKAEGDALVWVVESNGAGAILVNGVDVSKM